MRAFMTPYDHIGVVMKFVDDEPLSFIDHGPLPRPAGLGLARLSQIYEYDVGRISISDL